MVLNHGSIFKSSSVRRAHKYKVVALLTKGRHPYPLCHAYRQMDDCGWMGQRADKRGKVGKLKYQSFVPSLARADKKTGLVGKKLFVHLTISVTKLVWTSSLTRRSNCSASVSPGAATGQTKNMCDK